MRKEPFDLADLKFNKSMQIPWSESNLQFIREWDFGHFKKNSKREINQRLKH
jgi:hypothetical protein